MTEESEIPENTFNQTESVQNDEPSSADVKPQDTQDIQDDVTEVTPINISKSSSPQPIIEETQDQQIEQERKLEDTSPNLKDSEETEEVKTEIECNTDIQNEENILQNSNRSAEEPLDITDNTSNKNVEKSDSTALETKLDELDIAQNDTVNELNSQSELLDDKLPESLTQMDMEEDIDETGSHPHTWRPKGKYELNKTEIKFEDVVPCEIPDVDSSTVSTTEHNQNAEENKEYLLQLVSSTDESTTEYSLDAQKYLRHTVISGEALSPLEIPLGLPLLAKILPKEENTGDEHRDKIPLERLFTPATDTESIVPHKKKRAYASSCFYRPEHPTIDDQVELAHKISVSLVDENNKSSKGQTMYIKRKNRSSKWIHQAIQDSEEEIEDVQTPQISQTIQTTKEKPRLKLIMNPKGIQDHNDVQRQYDELMAATMESTQHFTRMEVGMGIAAHLESPTGKGAELFARRRKRMDKFIVDEKTVQQQQDQQQQLEQHQQQLQQNSLLTLQVNESMDDEVTNLAATTFSNSLKIKDNESMLIDDINTSSVSENISTDFNQVPAAIYTAQVNYMNKPFVLGTMSDLSDISIYKLKQVSNEDHKLETKGKSFNLAPKGWGTYSDFYTPVHLGAH